MNQTPISILPELQNEIKEETMLMESRFCACGCGHVPLKPKSTFARGHWAKTSQGRTRLSVVNYRDARSDHGDGYLTMREAFGRPHKLMHVLLAEHALGRALPLGTEVHHVNGNRSDNRPRNLVICSGAFHRLLHVRIDALNVCGHADWRKCSFCGRYDDPAHLYIPPKRGTIEHRACGREYRRALKARMNHADA